MIGRTNIPETLFGSCQLAVTAIVVSGRISSPIGLGELTCIYPNEVVTSGMDGEVTVKNVDGMSVLVVGKKSDVVPPSSGNLLVSVLVSVGKVRGEVGVKMIMLIVPVSSGSLLVFVSVGKKLEKSVVVPASGLVAVSVRKSVMGIVVTKSVNEFVLRDDDESVGITGDPSVELGVSVAVNMGVSLGISVEGAVGDSKVSEVISLAEAVEEACS